MDPWPWVDTRCPNESCGIGTRVLRIPRTRAENKASWIRGKLNRQLLWSAHLMRFGLHTARMASPHEASLLVETPVAELHSVGP